MGTLKERILQFVRDNPGASFVHLCRALPECAGDLALSPIASPLIAFWFTSAEAADAIRELVRDEKLHLEITTRLVYEIDGASGRDQALNLPRVKGAYQYSRIHWLPVLLCEGPPQFGKALPQ